MIADVISNERVHCVLTEIFLGIDFRKCAPPIPCFSAAGRGGGGVASNQIFKKWKGALTGFQFLSF